LSLRFPWPLRWQAVDPHLASAARVIGRDGKQSNAVTVTWLMQPIPN
jgi:hypothetical protein